jgi:thiol-disulfide isomerase/thioredoxin
MTKNTTKLTALLLALLLSLSLLISCDEDNGAAPGGEDNSPIIGGEDSPNVSYGSDIGDTATPYSLDPVKGDEKVNIKDYRGKIVVLNFWGTWCPPCRNELPDFDRVASEYDDVVIIAVHSVEGRENAADYINDNFPYSKMIFAYDQSRPYTTDLYYDLLGGEMYYPYTVIINPDGVITYKTSGAMSHSQLLNAINTARN